MWDFLNFLAAVVMSVVFGLYVRNNYRGRIEDLDRTLGDVSVRLRDAQEHVYELQATLFEHLKKTRERNKRNRWN